MSVRFLSCIAYSALPFLTVFSSDARSGENALRPAWTLTPEARAVVAEMREAAKNYRPHTKRTAVFSRAQLKYGQQRTDFIHRWYDRPLGQNSAWAETGNPDRLLHPEAWKQTVRDVKLGGMDGLAACISLSRCDEVVGMSVMPGGELPILVELPYAYADKGLESHLKTAERALAMPNAFRIDGKVVLTRYPPIKDTQLDFPAKLRKALDERFGPDRFIVMFYVTPFEKHIEDKPLTAEVLEWAREHLRRCLRSMDGIFADGWEVYWPRRYGAGFEREVMIPLYQSVLAEPEFAGRKYFGMPMTPGHENCYRWSYCIDSQGTRTLVERMKTMVALRPDFLICCEWDEQNENTFFRPTVSNGYVHQRVMRHFSGVFAGRGPSVFPGDDTSVPNLVVSYRRSLIAGEPIEVEVLNIPDGTFKGQSFRCAFRWKDLSGKTVKEYAPVRLPADSLEGKFFVSPVTELVAADRVVVPELTVTASGGRRFVFGEGFWPLDLNAVRAVDTKWAKHSLRERTRGVNGVISAAPTGNGLIEVSGKFTSPEPVKSVEVLHGPDTVFMYDPAKPPRMDMETLKITMQARGNAPRSLALTGDIRFENAPGLEVITKKGRGRKPLSDGWRLRNSLYCNWDVNLFAAVPVSEIGKAEIVVDLAPSFKSLRIKVRDVIEKEVIGFSGPAGGNFVVRRHLSQISMPKPCNVKDGDFRFRMKPLTGSDVLRLRIVDGKGRVWRGSPLVLGKPSGKTRTFNVFERDENRVTELTVDSARVDEPSYGFGAERGSVIWSSCGRRLSGIMCGPVPLVTGFGQGESNYGDTLMRYIKGDDPAMLDNTPVRVPGPGGSTALRFDGSDYLMLPQQLAPKFTGFEVSFDVCPESLEGRQTLVDAGYHSFTLFLRNGVPEARMWSLRPSAKGPGRLKAGKWSRMRLTFDQKEVRIWVDGVSGKPVAHSGFQYQTRYTAVGAANRQLEFFRGGIANLRFRLL